MPLPGVLDPSQIMVDAERSSVAGVMAPWNGAHIICRYLKALTQQTAFSSEVPAEHHFRFEANLDEAWYATGFEAKSSGAARYT
jgi:hypothetical protein